MKSFKKFINLFVVLCLSINLLAACRTKEPPVAQQSFVGIELDYYVFGNISDAMEAIINEYEARTGVKVNLFVFNDFERYEKTILNELAEGDGPDLFSMPNVWFVSNYKKLTPMPTSKGTVQDFEQLFVDVATKDLVRTNQNGIRQVYGLPMYVDTLALYYNKDLYNDLVPERGRPASTWAGLVADVARLTKVDSSFSRFQLSGIAMGRSDNISTAIDSLYMLFLQHGVNFYNGNMSAANFASQNQGVVEFPAQAALELLTSFSRESERSYTWNELVADPEDLRPEAEAFARGEVAVILGYSDMYNYLLSSINSNRSAGENVIDPSSIGIAQIPQLEDPAVSTNKRVAYASYFAEGVSRNTEYPELAWDLLIHVTSRESLTTYFDQTKRPTSRRDMIQTQQQNPLYGTFVSQVGYAESFPVVDIFEYAEIFDNVISLVNERGLNQSYLRDAQEKVNRLLPAEGILIPVNTDALIDPETGEVIEEG